LPRRPCMVIGLGIAVFGGVAILVVSSRGPIDGLVGWGVFSAILIYTSGRAAVGILKRELRRMKSGSAT
jgi:hypothetical protein